MKTRDKHNNTANKYKRTHAWTYLNKIETDCSWVFGKLVSLMVFQSSFSLLKVIPGGHNNLSDTKL